MKLNSKLLAVIVCVSAFAAMQATTAKANGLACADALSISSSVELANEIPAIENFGLRGLLSSHPKVTPENVKIMSEKNISPWVGEVYVLPTMEAAIEHYSKVRNLADLGYYIIDKVFDPAKMSQKVEALPKLEEQLALSERVFNQILNKRPKMYSIERNPNPNPEDPSSAYIIYELSADQVQARVSASGSQWRPRVDSLGNHFKLVGWFYPEKLHGAFYFKDLWASSVFKELNYEARRLNKQDGYVWEFSKNEQEIRADLAIAAATDRKGQNTKGAAYYGIPENVQKTVDKFAKGEAFTLRAVRVNKETGLQEVLGGIVILKDGNQVDIQTTFYGVGRKKDDGILAAKIASMITMSRLWAEGVDRMYVMMVSAFSMSLKAKVGVPIVEGTNYANQLKQMPALKFDLSTGFDPAKEGSVPTQFASSKN